MALTLGQQLDEVNAAISNTMSAQSYQHGDRQKSNAALFRLREHKKDILASISLYGRDFIEGQETTPQSTQAYVQFN